MTPIRGDEAAETAGQMRLTQDKARAGAGESEDDLLRLRRQFSMASASVFGTALL